MNTAIDYALKLLEALPALIQAGHDASDMVLRVRNMRDEGRDPTPGEWDDLNARIDFQRKKLHSDDE